MAQRIDFSQLPDQQDPIDFSQLPDQIGGLVRPSEVVNPSGEWVDTPTGKQWKSSMMKTDRFGIPERSDTSMFSLDTEKAHFKAADLASKLPRPLQRIGGFLLDLPIGAVDAAVGILSDPLTPVAGTGIGKRLLEKRPEIKSVIKPELKAPIAAEASVVPEVVDVSKIESQLPAAQLEKPNLATTVSKPALVNAADANLPESVVKLRTAMDESKPLNVQQKELYRVERGEKAAKASDVTVDSEADLANFRGAFKGEHSKVEIEPFRNKLEQTDVDDLTRRIHSSGQLNDFEKLNAHDGLRRLLNGQVPRDYELGQMRKVFGEDFGGKLTQPMTLGRAVVGLGNNTKGLKSAGDFGSPFRQARNYAYRASWFKSIIPMIKSYGSKRIFDEQMSFIRNDPFFAIARDKMKVAFTDLAESNFNREESAVGKSVGNLPLVKSSNRAATIFNNKMRFEEAKTQYNVWKKAYESGMAIAKTAEEKAAAKMLNPDSPYVGEKLGDRINVATGRGKLPGNFEKVAGEFNALMFSPRLMSARIRSINRLLNPVEMYRYNPIERKDAVKQLLSVAAMGVTEAMIAQQLLKASGHEAHINLEPDSTDFMKVVVDGKTRFDPWGGYQQYFVPIFKIAKNTTTSAESPSGPGEQRSLNEGPFSAGGTGTLFKSFLENKLAPLASFGATLINRRELSGRPLNFTSVNPGENTVTRALANPIILQDAYEILTSDPTLGPLLIPDMFGQSVQVYDEK